MSTKRKFWIAGIVLAVIGVLIARVVAQMFVDQPVMQFGMFVLGVTIALAGLGVIMAGIRK